MTIVYTSKTGFTREYAQMLGRAAGLPVCALDEATGKVGPGSDILYLGWLMAGHISGIDHAVKRFHVRAACGVGMTPPGDKVLQDLARSNYVPKAPIFFLQGGWAPKKVGWLQRRMVGMAAIHAIRTWTCPPPWHAPAPNWSSIQATTAGHATSSCSPPASATSTNSKTRCAAITVRARRICAGRADGRYKFTFHGRFPCYRRGEQPPCRHAR